MNLANSIMVLTCRSNSPVDSTLPQTEIQQDISSLLSPLTWNCFTEDDSAVGLHSDF